MSSEIHSPRRANWPKATAICARLIQIASVVAALAVLTLGLREATFPTQESAVATTAGVIILAGWSLAAAFDRLVQLHSKKPNAHQNSREGS